MNNSLPHPLFCSNSYFHTAILYWHEKHLEIFPKCTYKCTYFLLPSLFLSPTHSFPLSFVLSLSHTLSLSLFFLCLLSTLSFALSLSFSSVSLVHSLFHSLSPSLSYSWVASHAPFRQFARCKPLLHGISVKHSLQYSLPVEGKGPWEHEQGKLGPVRFIPELLLAATATERESSASGIILISARLKNTVKTYNENLRNILCSYLHCGHVLRTTQEISHAHCYRLFPHNNNSGWLLRVEISLFDWWHLVSGPELCAMSKTERYFTSMKLSALKGHSLSRMQAMASAFIAADKVAHAHASTTHRRKHNARKYMTGTRTENAYVPLHTF